MDHDLGFTMAVDEQHRSRSLRVLLLSPSSLNTGTKQETAYKLESFHRTADQHHLSAVAFLLSEGSFCRASGKYNLDNLVGLQAL